MNTPTIPTALLEYLQGVFPNKLPDTYHNPEQIGRLMGHQQVIKHLEAAFAVQNRTVLQG